MTETGTQESTSSHTRRQGNARFNGTRISEAMRTGTASPFYLYRATHCPARHDRPAGIGEIAVGYVSWIERHQRFEIWPDLKAYALGADPAGYAARELSRDWSLYGLLPVGEVWYGYCDTLSFAVDLLISGERLALGNHPYRRVVRGVVRTVIL